MSSLLRFATVLVAGLLVIGCSSAAATQAPNPTSARTPVATATPPPTQTPTLAPTPLPTALPNGWALVVMTKPGTVEKIDPGVTDPETGRMTGIKIRSLVDNLSDPRVNGTLNMTGNAQPDSTGQIGYQWGTVTIENSEESWVGTTSGFIWAAGMESVLTASLTGRGGYAGFTYTFSGRNRGTTVIDQIGLIYRGAPPAP